MRASDERRRTREMWARGAAAGVLLLALLVLVGVPVSGVVYRAAGGVRIDDDGAKLETSKLVLAIGRTCVAAGAVATLALIMAFPTAFVLRGRAGARLGALLAVPMLLPSYFAYAGWNLLRAPRTGIGDLIASGPAWVSYWVGPVVAVWGLALWSWPLAALVIRNAVGRVDRSVLDSMELDGPGPVRRGLFTVRLVRGGVVGAFLLVALTMMGSMIPLDVSQFPTYSIVLLRWVNEHPSDIPVWRASWPLLVLAVVGTLVILGRVRDEGAPDGSPPGSAWRSRRRGVMHLAALVVWTLSVVAPGVLFLMSLREPPHAATLETIGRFLRAFWRDSGSAVVQSASVAARVGALALVLSAAAWLAASGWRRGRGARTAVVYAGVMLTVGLMPGVLIGTAVRRGWDTMAPLAGLSRGIGETSWLVVGAHLGRFAFVGALIALWLAGRETRDEKALRMIDGADTPRGFAHACLARHWPALVGGALITAILSFHEIESTVIVWPAGRRNLAQELLDALHFARDERLAAAAVNLMGAGIVLAYGASWLVMRSVRRNNAGS